MWLEKDVGGRRIGVSLEDDVRLIGDVQEATDLKQKSLVNVKETWLDGFDGGC